jgi:DNA-binding winged helix-turn-helix (wHTH) protein
MAHDSAHYYEFGEYRLYPEERQLRRAEGGEVVWLEPKTYEVLVALVGEAGRVVSKERLMEAVWAETYVEEGNLTDNVSKLRKALGDDARRPRYVETAPKVGYRFVAEVSEVREEGEELQVLEATRFARTRDTPTSCGA